MPLKYAVISNLCENYDVTFCDTQKDKEFVQRLQRTGTENLQQCRKILIF